MSQNSAAFQASIYALLDSEFDQTPTVAVYDFVPQGAAYPYITIDFQDDLNADFLNARKTRKFMYLSVWSDYRGQGEVLEIMERIDRVLHNNTSTSLGVNNWYQYWYTPVGNVAQLRVASSRTNREPDGVTFMGQVRLEVLLEN